MKGFFHPLSLFLRRLFFFLCLHDERKSSEETMLKLTDLLVLLRESAETGVTNVACAQEPIQPQITKAEAYRLYGRSIVDRWIAEKLISPLGSKKSDSSKWFDRSKLAAIAASSNRITYLPVANRK
ncbi:hypothetical protein [Mucilaginibacter sp. UYCu711]|uniref:hypothetical protein n=1 Tax=Mucilaginibacter sp. UYCu711 TaxID=3156339 RepID=UPI003D1E9265